MEWIISLITGAIGGNVAGAIFKNLTLGPLGNTLAGVVGGGVGAEILNALTGAGVGGGSVGGQYRLFGRGQRRDNADRRRHQERHDEEGLGTPVTGDAERPPVTPPPPQVLAARRLHVAQGLLLGPMLFRSGVHVRPQRVDGDIQPRTARSPWSSGR